MSKIKELLESWLETAKMTGFDSNEEKINAALDELKQLQNEKALLRLSNKAFRSNISQAYRP